MVKKLTKDWYSVVHKLVTINEILTIVISFEGQGLRSGKKGVKNSITFLSIFSYFWKETINKYKTS